MKRTICHECGTETTHRSKYQIFKYGEILTVCPVCHARYIRERAKEKSPRPPKRARAQKDDNHIIKKGASKCK